MITLTISHILLQHTFNTFVVPTILGPKDCWGDFSPFVGPTISDSQLKTVGATFLYFVVPTILGPQVCWGDFWT